MLPLGLGLALIGAPGATSAAELAPAPAASQPRVSLREVVATLAKRAPGRLLEAHFEPGASGSEILRVRWLAATGRRIDFLIEPTTGAVLDQIR